jgi:hypothetical protein
MMEEADSPFCAYIFPCVVEDICKVGFTRDPLARIAQFHPRWFEFFDLEAGVLVAAESQREARDLELLLRRPLRAHRAPMPMTISSGAGGKTEWLRGAAGSLSSTVAELSVRGYRVDGLGDRLRAALTRRADALYEWAQTALEAGAFGNAGQAPTRAVMDTLDAYRSLGLEVAGHVPAPAYAAYRRYVGIG